MTKVEPKLTARVLGDLFHIMDRVKVPMHHDFKAVFQALWALFFIMDAGNAEIAKKFMGKKGRSWSIDMTFNFSYIALRVKIMAPPPHMLYFRVKAVFDFFGENKDTKTRSLLLNHKARKKSYCVLKAILRGGYYDLPGPLYRLYYQKTDAYGGYMVKKDSLWIYRSMRATSLL